ncbi:MAG: OmpA family protein [Bacteroidia bacterium]
MKKILYTVLSILFCLNATFAQNELVYSGTKNKKAEYYFGEALKSFQLGDNLKAANFIEKALGADGNYIDAMMLQAEIKMMNEKYDEAEKIYNKVIGINPDFPMSYFGLAQMAYNTGKYKKAAENAEKYLEYKDFFNKKGLVEEILRNSNFAEISTKNPVAYNPVNLGPNINTQFNEYFPGITADEQTLIFTRLVNNNNEEFYISNKVNNQWQKASNIGPPINTDKNEGTVSLSADGQYIFYTACNRVDGFGSCDLLLSRLDGNTWVEPKFLNPPVNTRNWESQPSISFDGKTLYFSSNAPGGYGKSDIWMTTYKNGRWTQPVNCGPEINTSADEQSPFIAKDDHTLYFASDGHAGMGGLDLFYSRKDSTGNFTKPVNIGYPINTPNDETCLVIAANGVDAYISANRPEGYGGLDIYKFELYEAARPQKTGYVKGIVFDATTRKKIAAKIELIDLATAKTVVESYSNKVTGEFLATLQGNKNYALNVSAQGYLFYSQNFSLQNQSAIDPLVINVPLEPIRAGAKMVLNNIFFDTDKFNLKDESLVELNKLVQLLNTNTSVKIEIGGHTDNTGDVKKNLTLSQNRAKAVFDYLVKNNISANRLSYKGYADTQPVADNNTPEGKAKNRRTEIKIVE